MQTLNTMLVRDRPDMPLGSQKGVILLPMVVEPDAAKSMMSGPMAEQLIMRSKVDRKIVGKLWTHEAASLSKMKPDHVSPKGIALSCFLRASTKDRQVMISKERLPKLLNFKPMTLRQFALNPEDLEMLEGELDPDVHNTNWEVLSTISSMYIPSMRKVIAEKAYELQLELERLVELCKCHLNEQTDFSGDNFNMKAAISSAIELSEIPRANEVLQKRLPLIYNSIHTYNQRLIVTDEMEETYGSRGCPQVKRMHR